MANIRLTETEYAQLGDGYAVVKYTHDGETITVEPPRGRTEDAPTLTLKEREEALDSAQELLAGLRQRHTERMQNG